MSNAGTLDAAALLSALLPTAALILLGRVLRIRFRYSETFWRDLERLAYFVLLPSLFVRRRRIWIRVAPGQGSRTVVEVAGLARGEDVGLPREVTRVLDVVSAAVSAGAAGDATGRAGAPTGDSGSVPREG